MMAEKLATSSWLLWRLGKDGPEFMGLYSSQKRAEDDIAVLREKLNQQDWHTKQLPLIGWAFIAESGRILENDDVGPRSDQTH
jgi:hypothetical protein